MKFYTTYFARLRNLPSGIVPISICGKAPQGYKGIQYKKLAPSWKIYDDYKNKGGSEEDYVTAFNKDRLGVLDVIETVNELKSLAENAEAIALVCYEKPDSFCHRHLVSDWLNKAGFSCEEWKEN